MVRYTHINHLILQTLSKLDIVVFPLFAETVIETIPNCRLMSYQKFAELNDCSIKEVIELCESRFGCAHYDVANDRYLILCNTSTAYNNNKGRQRWTVFHEIGHILCKHHDIAAFLSSTEDKTLLPRIDNRDFEMEADYFAATILAPFPLFKMFEISSPVDVQIMFGLSREASINRYKQYAKWLMDHKKTSWENDILRLYLQKLDLFEINGLP